MCNLINIQCYTNIIMYNICVTYSRKLWRGAYDFVKLAKINLKIICQYHSMHYCTALECFPVLNFTNDYSLSNLIPTIIIIIMAIQLSQTFTKCISPSQTFTKPMQPRIMMYSYITPSQSRIIMYSYITSSQTFTKPMQPHNYDNVLI